MEAGLRSCGMTEQQLYDLAPALELMAFGLVLALGPCAGSGGAVAAPAPANVCRRYAC
jgi:hypothetical protein